MMSKYKKLFVCLLLLMTVAGMSGCSDKGVVVHDPDPGIDRGPDPGPDPGPKSGPGRK